MKLLIALIFVIVNTCLISAAKTPMFVNFNGAYDSNSCNSGNVNSTGYSIALNQCVPVSGMLSYIINDDAPTTNWFISQGSDSSIIIKEYDETDGSCKSAPINTRTIPGSDATCAQTPSFININNTLLSSGDLLFSKVSISSGKPIWEKDSIVYSQYNTPTTVCNYGNLQFSITYPSGSTIYENKAIKISVLCNQVNQSMMFKCKADDSGDCGETFTDTFCQTSGDVTIYCV